MNAEVAPDLGWLLLVSLLTVASAMCLLGSVSEGAQKGAWLWASSFVVFSFIAAYCFWRVV